MNKSYTSKRYQVNNRIRAQELRVIDGNGDNLGVVPTRDALKRAMEQELDLVVIAEKANPPVAKILDFNKYLYEENKKSSASKAKSKKSELKEFKFGPNIGDGDLNLRIRRSREFLEDGNRVRITVQLRGRQRAFPDVGREKIEIIAKELEDIAKIEGQIKTERSDIRATFVRK